MQKNAVLIAILGMLALTSAMAEGSSPREARPPMPSAGPLAVEPLVFIVNKSNPVDNLSFAELRNVFLAERGHWPNGQKITLVMHQPGQPEREAVLRSVYRMSESDFNRHFLHTNFTGNVQPAPKLLSSGSGVRRFVFNVVGAIGYVRASEADGSVKAIRIDGRAPGEPGYRINIGVR